MALGLCVVSGLYGYGAAIETNALLDRSTPRNIATPVLGFRNTRGGTGYEIDLSPLSAGTQEAKVPISLNVYSRVQLNQAVCVQLKSGALGIPWYEVLLCK